MTARNSVGNSLMSEEVVILAAQEPDPIVSLINVDSETTAYQIGLDWSGGVYNGGAEIIDYTLSYRIVGVL